VSQTKGERREQKQRKRREMRTHGFSLKNIQRLIGERARRLGKQDKQERS